MFEDRCTAVTPEDGNMSEERRSWRARMIFRDVAAAEASDVGA